MSTKLPYVNQPGGIVKVFEKVRQAQTPERFTGDFLVTKLGFRGGNSRQFIPLAKKMGFLGSDGKPTETYTRFRNDGTSRAAMAEALRTGYSEVFQRNEYAGNLSRSDFKGMVLEITGLEADSRVVQLVCQTFEALKALADFDAKPRDMSARPPQSEAAAPSEDSRQPLDQPLDLNLSYTINLVLPKSDDPAVFDAIFRSLREHLLRR